MDSPLIQRKVLVWSTFIYLLIVLFSAKPTTNVPVEALASSSGRSAAAISAAAVARLIFLGLDRGNKAESESSSRCELHGLIRSSVFVCLGS